MKIIFVIAGLLSISLNVAHAYCYKLTYGKYVNKVDPYDDTEKWPNANHCNNILHGDCERLHNVYINLGGPEPDPAGSSEVYMRNVTPMVTTTQERRSNYFPHYYYNEVWQGKVAAQVINEVITEEAEFTVTFPESGKPLTQMSAMRYLPDHPVHVYERILFEPTIIVATYILGSYQPTTGIDKNDFENWTSTQDPGQFYIVPYGESCPTEENFN